MRHKSASNASVAQCHHCGMPWDLAHPSACACEGEELALVFFRDQRGTHWRVVPRGCRIVKVPTGQGLAEYHRVDIMLGQGLSRACFI